MPKATATSDPAITPTMGAQSRHAPLAFSAMALMTNTVESAATGAAATGEPSGTSSNMEKTTGITLTTSRRTTVAETVGVRIRRSHESRAENRT